MLAIISGMANGEIFDVWLRSMRSTSFSVMSIPPTPEPIVQPQRNGSGSEAKSTPESATAIFAAASAYWVKRAQRRASLASTPKEGASKPFTSPAMVTGKPPETSNFVIVPIPFTPRTAFSQKVARLLPMGETTPMPVMTTLRMNEGAAKCRAFRCCV